MTCKNIYKFPLFDSFLKSRFLKKVHRRNDGCWEWRGCRTIWGYGQFWMDGRMFPAHRAAYYLLKEENPREKFVLHRCDNRECVNPDHLWLGTQKDNIQDAITKGRWVPWNYGSRKFHAKTCPCGNDFSSKKESAEYCSKACAARAMMKRRWDNKQFEKLPMRMRIL